MSSAGTTTEAFLREFHEGPSNPRLEESMARLQNRGRGYLYLASGTWRLRYREDVVQPDGTTKHVQVSSPALASTSEAKTKTEARQLADEFLDSLRKHAPSALGTMEIVSFTENVYLPWVKKQKSASTYNGYRKTWSAYCGDRLKGIRLRDFRTCDGEALMQRIANEERTPKGEILAHLTLAHTKSFLSGIFTHAKRQGYLNGLNPMKEVSIPAGNEAQDTYAYTLEEELKMLAALSGMPRLAIAIASFTGLSLAELRGLDWTDYTDDTIRIRRNLWRNVVGKPKIKKRRGAVPVIDSLKRYLDPWRKEAGWILANESGESLNLDYVTRKVIAPTVKEAGVAWHGFHSFRRGLATNLDRVGIPDTVIQAILRHSSVQVTRQSYIKEVREDVTAAMQCFERELGQVEQKGRPN